VGGSQLPNEFPDPIQSPSFYQHGVVADGDLPRGGYQVTSPAPARTFATRASMKRRSERRLR
jgi:hypothetical protein